MSLNKRETWIHVSKLRNKIALSIIWLFKIKKDDATDRNEFEKADAAFARTNKLQT